MNVYNLYTDGSCIYSKGPHGKNIRPHNIGYGAVLYTEDYVELATTSGTHRGGTNNIAEYWGLIEGLIMAREYLQKEDTLLVHMDSELVVRQMQNVYMTKSSNMVELKREADKIIREMEETKEICVLFRWVKREDNTRADGLSRAHALDTRIML